MSVDFAAARTIMVDSQVRPQDVTNVALLDAMRRVPRESLFTEDKRYLAYADTDVEYTPGHWLLRPRDIGKLLQALAPRHGERALAIAAPYGAALLSAMGLAVTAVGAGDSPEGAFDVILCEGAVDNTPEAWRQALVPDGRLGVIEREGATGRAMLYMRTGDRVAARPLFDCAPAFLLGFAPKTAFVF